MLSAAREEQQHLNGQADVEGCLDPATDGEPSNDDIKGLSEAGEGVGETSFSSGQQSAARWQPPDRAVVGGTHDDNQSGFESRPIARQDSQQQQEQEAPPVVARSLDSVRSSLIRQEETIIFALIEREQFGQNPQIYKDRSFRVNRKDVADIYGRDASFLEYMLCETEKLHATGEQTHTSSSSSVCSCRVFCRCVCLGLASFSVLRACVCSQRAL